MQVSVCGRGGGWGKEWKDEERAIEWKSYWIEWRMKKGMSDEMYD